VDLVRSARGPLVLEVNASPGLEGIETVTGVDVAEAVIRHLETLAGSEPAGKPRGARRGVRPHAADR
ncbi:MAG: hypothetical protein ACREPK_10890, partial [Rhodanobacteraceae bacterium]